MPSFKDKTLTSNVHKQPICLGAWPLKGHLLTLKKRLALLQVRLPRLEGWISLQEKSN